MGCSGSKDGVKKPATGANKPGVNPAKMPQPAPKGKLIPIDAATLKLAHTKDDKKKVNKIDLDLQYKENHRQFVDKITASKLPFQRLPNVDQINILLGKKDKAATNKKLVEVIKNQFPAQVQYLTLKSLEVGGENAKDYVEAFHYAKVQVSHAVSFKNMIFDGTTLSTVLDAFAESKKIEFYGCSFENLSKTSINATLAHKTEELALSYCKGLDNDSVGAVITAVSKNKSLTGSLKTIYLEHNKIKDQKKVKDALDKATIKAKLVFKEAEEKKPAGKDKKKKEASEENSGDEEENEDEGDDEENEGDDEEAEDDEEDDDYESD